jgi:TolB-like protein
MAEGDGMDGASGGGTSRTVFLSYASHDTEIANTVCRELESRGIRCWIAPRDVAPGALYADAIVRAINEARVLLVVLSQSAVASSHVGREIERAASKRKQIIALRIDAASLSPALEYFLSESQWVDMPALGMQAALGKIADVIRAGPAMGTSTIARGDASQVRKRPGLASKRVLLPAAIMIVLATAIGVAVRFWPSNHGDAHAPAVAQISDKSIAVLPFADMSEKHDQEYFGDGMAEEILNLLVRVPQLKVIGRTSSFMFKGRTDDLRTIGTTLGSAYLVEGSVRRAGDRIRVTAELIDARDGAHRWSETYDRDVSDVLKVQREIATSLVRALELEVNASTQAEHRPWRYGEAYESYLRGLHAWNRFDESGFEEATVDFGHALDVDPSFAPAAEELARTLLMQTLWNFVPPEKGYAQARAAAEAALRLNQRSALAHAVLGSVHTAYDYDWPAAERELKEAMSLAPRDPHVLIFAADECLAVGRWTEAVRLTDAASAADPLHANIFEDSGEAYLRLGRLAEAENSARRVLEITPTYAWGHYNLTVILLVEGKLEAALAESQKEATPDAG